MHRHHDHETSTPQHHTSSCLSPYLHQHAAARSPAKAIIHFKTILCKARRTRARLVLLPAPISRVRAQIATMMPQQTTSAQYATHTTPRHHHCQHQQHRHTTQSHAGWGEVQHKMMTPPHPHIACLSIITLTYEARTCVLLGHCQPNNATNQVLPTSTQHTIHLCATPRRRYVC